MSLVMAFMFSRNLISGLRVLRALPTSGLTIALVLLMAAWIPAIIGSGLVILLLTGDTDNGSAWGNGFAIELALVSFLPMVNLRFKSPLVAVPAFILPFVLIGVPGALLSENPGTHWIVVTASFLMILVLTLRTWWEIRRGRHAYLTRVLPIEGLIAT